MAQEKIEFKKENIIETPKDVIEEATVTDLKKTTWREYLTQKTEPTKLEETIKKFPEPDKPIVIIQFKTNKTEIVGTDTANIYNPIPDNSKLGRIVSKYDGLNVGSSVKVAFDGKGYTRIHLDKAK